MATRSTMRHQSFLHLRWILLGSIAVAAGTLVQPARGQIVIDPNAPVQEPQLVEAWPAVETWSMDPVAADDHPCGPEGKDGFFSRLIPQQLHGADFRPACRAHDACYANPGADRAACDRQFRQDLMTACESSWNPALCRATARNMTRGTRVGGERAFQRAQTRVGENPPERSLRTIIRGGR